MIRLYKSISEREICYYIQGVPSDILLDILDYPSEKSRFDEEKGGKEIFEVGPKLSWVTSWSTTVKAILTACGATITRIEYSIRSLVPFEYDKMTHRIYHHPLQSFDIYPQNSDPSLLELEIERANTEYNLGFDRQDIVAYNEIFKNRYPRLIELYDLAQSNSEHSRHHFFRGKLFIDGVEQKHTLFDLVKRTYNHKRKFESIPKAFSDDASVMSGSNVRVSPNPSFKKLYPTFTAETHNYPTSICPYEGAMTGVGGRQRDGMSVALGGELLAGTAGYAVADLKFESSLHLNPTKILIEASNGVSDYGNKFGEPLIQGFTRTYKKGKVGWVKPILFSGGVGQVSYPNKGYPREGLFVVKIGGPAYRIGIGGGSASSQTKYKNENAVQRGDPMMNQKIERVIKTCITHEPNPIIALSDQGAGGNANLLKELVSPYGAVIRLDDLITGDETMTPLELWVAEYQESIGILTNKPKIVRDICEKEGVPMCVIGTVTNNGRMIVTFKDKTIVDLDLNKTVEHIPQKTFYLSSASKIPGFQKLTVINYPFTTLLKRVLKLPSVGSKRFLTVKVDRSVGGLVAQQQCVGPLHTPVADVAVTAQSWFDTRGIATSIGERPLLSLIDPCRMVRMAVAEALTNLVWAGDSFPTSINCSANWMWPAKDANLVRAVEALSNVLMEVGIVLDGGKDSLSMKTEDGIEAPPSLVISCYKKCDVTKVITPVITEKVKYLYLLTLGGYRCRMGGSALFQAYAEIDRQECPDLDSPRDLVEMCNFVNRQREQGVILCGHDRSDGGLITCLVEMCLAGNYGGEFEIPNTNVIAYLFNEEVGLVVGTSVPILKEDIPFGTTVTFLGKPRKNGRFVINRSNETVINEKLSHLRRIWERTSFELDAKQSNPLTVLQEEEVLCALSHSKSFEYRVTFPLPSLLQNPLIKPIVTVLRAEGTNGHREMIAVFQLCGFIVQEVHLNELKRDPSLIDQSRGLIFAGGFSYSDVLGAGKGVSTIIKYHSKINSAINRFFNRSDTFSLGVCNGFQIMCRLNKFGEDIRLETNVSGRFESRCVSVRIVDDSNPFFYGMKDSVLPIWSAHKEGRFVGNARVVLEYADNIGNSTDLYPFSPNGGRVAGVISGNGRHLGMMPHPERTFLPWQLPWNPQNWTVSPWLRMFINIRTWCVF